MIRQILLSSALLLGIVATQAQSIPFPQPSPTTTVSQNFATSKIELSYSRPSAKGRKVFGDVVPFGKFWRTGANSATTISFGEDVKFAGKDVKAGKYGLLSFPGETEWTIILSEDITVNNEGDYKPENDVVRVQLKSARLNDFVETFTIDINDIKNNACNINLKWEHTVVSIPVTADYDVALTKQVESTMSKDTRPYFSAANYYYENNKDMNMALNWINKAVEANPKAYWAFLLKAKIQLKMNDLNGAAASSATSTELAKADKDDAYIRNNEKLMAEIMANPAYKPTPVKKKK